jgi:hypothetical protein
LEDARNKIADAFAVIEARRETSAFKQCMIDAFVNYERHDVMVEDLVDILNSRPTTVDCVEKCWKDAVACTSVPSYPNMVPEVLDIETAYILDSSTTADMLAGIIAHEAVHTAGFNHPGSNTSLGHPWSVPQQARACMRDLAPNGWSRAHTWGDNELQPVGGGGGQPFSIRCPAGAHATGISASTSSYVNRLRLHCSDGSSTAWVGAYNDSTVTRTVHCAQGSSIVGFDSRSDAMLRRLSSYCAPDAEILDDTENPTLAGSALGGDVAGTEASRRCPVGMVVVGALGRDGGRIDQVRWLCRDLDGMVLPNPHNWGYRGTKNGNAKLGLCFGDGIVHGLYGKASTELLQLGAECYPSATQSNGLPTLLESAPGGGPTWAHGIDYNGGIGGSPFELPCPDGKAVVGLQFRSGGRVDGIGGICADPSAWASSAAAQVSFTDMHGGTGGSSSLLYCPPREFLVGFETWASWSPSLNDISIHAVEPRCRELRAPGCASSVTAVERFGGAKNMTGCAGSVPWFQRELLCAPGYSACTAAEWMANRGKVVPSHNYWTNDDLRYGGWSGACWASDTSGNQCNQPMRVCKPGGDDDWDGDGIQDNDCNWSMCGWKASTPNEYFGGCYNDDTAGTLCCED